LHAAHEARDSNGQPLELVHRDVSPHNVLIGTDGIARVLDFGVAKARGRAQTTRVGQLKGKLAYMAPEQLGGKVTLRSDVFSASVVLWEALTGTRLFQGDDEGAVVDRLLHKAIPSPRLHAPAVTRELEGVVMRGLARDPSKRFATARDMAIALESQAALATPIEVGAWVERVAGATLAQRAERVAAIEAEFGRASGPRSAGDPPSGEVPHRAAASSLTGATSATVAVPGLARTDDKTTVDTGGEPTRTGVATVSDMHVPRRTRTRLVSIVSLMGTGAVVGLLLLVRAGVHGSPDASTSASAVLAPAVGSETVPVPPVASGSVATDDPTEARPPAEVPTRRLAPPPVRRRSGCSPPYTIDARGLRHYKPECL
jgi:serine/threonine-protein kinase